MSPQQLHPSPSCQLPPTTKRRGHGIILLRLTKHRWQVWAQTLGIQLRACPQRQRREHGGSGTNVRTSPRRSAQASTQSIAEGEHPVSTQGKCPTVAVTKHSHYAARRVAVHCPAHTQVALQPALTQLRPASAYHLSAPIPASPHHESKSARCQAPARPATACCAHVAPCCTQTRGRGIASPPRHPHLLLGTVEVCRAERPSPLQDVRHVAVLQQVVLQEQQVYSIV